MKSVLFLFFLFIFISCKDDSNPTSPANTSPQFDYTEGFPNVFGDYTAITNEFYASCSDGSSGSSPAITMQLAVVQDKEKIICYGRDTTIQNDTSIVLLETTDLEGILKKMLPFYLKEVLNLGLVLLVC
ncbi:MAG: hypothetical protein GY936_16630 [Ignavibacteriae bacterium]|nr:hypothetical protein [Ignavibacteriota bacterium]